MDPKGSVESGERRDIDDLGGLGCPEQGQGCGCHAVCAEEIRLEYGLRLVDARFLSRPEETNAGIVDEHVKVANDVAKVIERDSHRIIRADVELEKRELRQIGWLRRAPAGPKDGETIVPQRESDRPTEPRSRTRDESYSLILSFARIRCHPGALLHHGMRDSASQPIRGWVKTLCLHSSRREAFSKSQH